MLLRNRIARRTGGQAGAPRHRRIALASTAATLAVAAAAVPARANLTAVGPVDPATQVPAWFQDSNGLKLGLCLDGPPFCLTSTADFNVPNGEGFYFQAGATIPINGTGSAKLTLAQEAINAPGGRGAFMRVRVDLINAVPNATYAVTHPFGTVSVTTDGTGRGRDVVDTGCPIGPCPTFVGALGGQIGPFLTWTPDPAVPPNHIGDSVTPHTVTGGTNGNSFTVAGPGGGTTNLFTVAGKLAGPPVPVLRDQGPVDFGSSLVGVPVVKEIPIASFGVPDPAGASNLAITGVGLSGPGAAGYHILANTCTAGVLPSGAFCSVTVQFLPGLAGATPASLDLSSNAAPGLDRIALSGVGTAPPAVAVANANARSRLTISKLRTTHRLSRARVLRRGLALSMLLPQGTEIVRIAIHRVRRGGRVSRRNVALAFRVPSRAGQYRVRLDSRTLRRRLTAGLYQVNVTPGVSRRELGRTSTTRIRITRR